MCDARCGPAATDPTLTYGLGTGERFLARVILRNAYGPLPGCRLFLKPAEAPAAAWQEMDLREELIESDGEIRPRHPGEPAPEQAAPWSATYELGRLDPGTRRLALKIQSEDQDLHGVLDDWTLIDEPP